KLRAGTPIRLMVLDLKLPPLPVTLTSVPDNPKLQTLLSSLPQPAAPAPQTPLASAPTSIPSAPLTAKTAEPVQTVANASSEHHFAAPTSVALPSQIPNRQPSGTSPTPTPQAIYLANEVTATKPATIPSFPESASQPFSTPLQSDRVASYGKVLPHP